MNKADLGSLYSPSAEIKELRAEVIELSGGPGLSRILLDGRSDRPAIVFEDSLGKQRITLRLDQRSMSHFDLTDPLGNTRLGMVVFNYGPWDAGIYLEDWRGRQIWTRP